MNWQEADILSVLDRCSSEFKFPMLDNGYVYLAATRMSVYRSELDWALVIEVFGFSPRAGSPDTSIYTFGSRLENRPEASTFVTDQAYQAYLQNNPNNECRFVYPIEDGEWQDPEDTEMVAESNPALELRGRTLAAPAAADYDRLGITLEDAPRVRVFELCRALAAGARDEVLASVEERRYCIPGMDLLLQLEEWNHPDLADEDCLPSGSETFQQLARVLATGEPTHYVPTLEPNTHWKNWPDGGTR